MALNVQVVKVNLSGANARWQQVVHMCLSRLMRRRACSEANAPSWGRALVRAEFANLCWQPPSYALYNRPISTKFSRQAWMSAGNQAQSAYAANLSESDCACALHLET